MEISVEFGRNNLEAMLKDSRKKFKYKQKQFEKLGSYVAALRGRDASELKAVGHFLGAMDICDECSYSRDRGESELICDVLNEVSAHSNAENYSRWHDFQGLSESEKEQADLVWRLPYREEGQKCVLTRIDRDVIWDLTNVLEGQSDELRKELDGIHSQITGLELSLEKAEPKPYFPQFRPGDYSKGGESGIVYSRGMFLKRKFGGISCDGYLVYSGVRDAQLYHWKRPEVMLEWEFEYLRKYKEFRDIWLGFAGEDRNKEVFGRFRSALLKEFGDEVD